MPVMKESFLRNGHDTTFSPTGLYNFVSGSLLTDDSGNGKNLTVYDEAVDDSDFIYGKAEGLSHFSYYRNNASEFQYTGAMSFCCLVSVQKFDTDANSDYVVLVACDTAGAGQDARYGLQINPDFVLRYTHQNNGTNYQLLADRRIRTRNTWNHIAFTRDSNGTGIKIYFNGDQVAAGTMGAAPGTTGTAYLAFGETQGNPNSKTNDVALTSCAIYDQELSANEIKYLARKTLGYHRVQ
tara:strand:+ start:2987 stop:3703 length:717 start_codon:yes stop_codon:yes gene_type:complete